jgi:hypothetical protein
MNEVEVDVSQTPGFILRLSHGHSVFSAVVIIPQLRGDEDLFPFNQAFINRTFNALTGFVLVLIVVCAVEETIAYPDGLGTKFSAISCRTLSASSARLHCKLCRLRFQLALSRVRSQLRASFGQRPKLKKRPP